MATAEPTGDDDRASRQRQARALGDPTRFAIFCQVLEAPAPVRVDALTRHFGLNHNAIRQHLAKLVDAGLVEERTAARQANQGRGRSALQYRVEPEAAASWSAHSPYQQLALLLVEVAKGGASPVEVGAAAGRRIPVSATDEPLARLTDEMARRGFRPETNGTELVLARCPFAAAALEAPEIICELHRGLAEGMLEALGGAYEVEALVINHPSQGGCRLRVHPVGMVAAGD